MTTRMMTAAFAALAVCAAVADSTVWLDELDLADMSTGWGEPRKKRSVNGKNLKVGDKEFARGVGTHALSSYEVDCGGKAVAFDAMVGVDTEVGGGSGSVKFIVKADGKSVAESPVLRAGMPAHALHADLTGAKTVELFACDARDGIDFDHADWCDARFTVADGATVRPISSCARQLGVLTPAHPALPRINGPKVYGVRPGHPILYRLPVSGERPMTYSAENLPAGVAFDAAKGILSGAIAERGEYKVLFAAKNAKGADSRELKIVVGDKIALTPPMGWNSWNCFAGRVTAEDIRNAADVFDKSELANHGWCYVNIDDFWQNKVEKTDDPTLSGPVRNADGTIGVNKRFPSMKELADYVHSKGLKIGLYSSPGPWTCGGCAGSWKHEWQDAKTYAEWGYDYLKYDWCGYSSVDSDVFKGSGVANRSLPYRLMGEALAAQDRDIVFSLCQYGMAEVSTWGENVGGHCWRTTGDITDTWRSMSGILEAQAELWPYARPGAWNDPDMLVLGPLGWGNIHPTRLTPNEQYTHMSFWCILCSPLLIGCDMTRIDDFTMSLLTNDEVLETNQDPLGAAAARVAQDGTREVWAKPMSDGSLVFALYNRGPRDERISVDFAALGLEGQWRVRDLWRQTDLGTFAGQYTAEVWSHATTLVRLFPADASSRLVQGLRDIRDNATYLHFERTRPVDKPNRRGASAAPCEDCPRRR